MRKKNLNKFFVEGKSLLFPQLMHSTIPCNEEEWEYFISHSRWNLSWNDYPSHRGKHWK